MFKVLFIILVGVSTLFAGAGGGGGGSTSGGGSFGTEYNSDKFSSLQVETKVEGVGNEIYIETFTHVRYKKFFISYSWINGLARTRVLKNGKEMLVKNLKIDQHVIFFPNNDLRYPQVTKLVKRTINLDNVSSITLNLSENYAMIATMHYATINEKLYKKFEYNNWGEDSSTPTKEDIIKIGF